MNAFTQKPDVKAFTRAAKTDAKRSASATKRVASGESPALQSKNTDHRKARIK